MDLLNDLKMSLLNFHFVLVYIIHKNHLSYLKDKILECFLRRIIDVYFFLMFFFITYNDGKFNF